LQATEDAWFREICTLRQLDLGHLLLARLGMPGNLLLGAALAGAAGHQKGIRSGGHPLVERTVHQIDLPLVVLVGPEEGRLVVVEDPGGLVGGMHPGGMLGVDRHGVHDGIADGHEGLAMVEGLEGPLDDRIGEHRLHGFHFALESQSLQQVLPIQATPWRRIWWTCGPQAFVVNEGSLDNRPGSTGFRRADAADQHYLSQALGYILHIIIEQLVGIQLPSAVAAASLDSPRRNSSLLLKCRGPRITVHGNLDLKEITSTANFAVYTTHRNLKYITRLVLMEN